MQQTATQQQPLALEIIETCQNLINRFQTFTAVDVSNFLKLRGVTNDDGTPIRHRNINEDIRRFMIDNFLPANPSSWEMTTIYPAQDVNGNPISAPNGIFLYHMRGADISRYEVPTLLPPNATASSYTPIAPTPVVPSVSTPPQVAQNPMKVSFVCTDDTKTGKDAYIFRVECDETNPEKDIHKAVCEKILQRVPGAKKDSIEIVDVSGCNTDIIVVVSARGPIPETKYGSFDEFVEDLKDEEIPEPTGKQVIAFSSAPAVQLPAHHLAVESDGRVRISKILIDQVLAGQKLTLVKGDVPRSVRHQFIV